MTSQENTPATSTQQMGKHTQCRDGAGGLSSISDGGERGTASQEGNSGDIYQVTSAHTHPLTQQF